MWQAADKAVYSSTLDQVASERTRLEREVDPDAVRELKATSDHDLTIEGPGLATAAEDPQSHPARVRRGAALVGGVSFSGCSCRPPVVVSCDGQMSGVVVGGWMG